MVRLAVEHDRSRLCKMSELQSLFGSIDGVLLDFDGPICDLFAGYPAATIADELRAYLYSRDVVLDDPAEKTSDPLALLQWVASHRPQMLDSFERLEIAAERSAAETAAPAERLREILYLAVETGRRVAVVSNNSRPAIERFLELHGLSSKVTSIVSRIAGRPELMKPNAAPVIRAAKDLDLPVTACVLVGDSTSDITAARDAGSRCIGYAKNSAARAHQLSMAGADLVINSWDPLAAALLNSPER